MYKRQPQEAAPIGVGSFQGGICERRGDFFFVDVRGPWRLDLTFSHAVGDLDLIVFQNGQPLVGRTGEPIGANSSNDNEVFEWQNPATVFIYGYDGATVPYRLEISQ